MCPSVRPGILIHNVSSNYNFSNLNQECGPCGTLSVTYDVIDDCGNNSPITLNLSFNDNFAPNEIAIGDVIRAVDESVDATRCQGQSDCQGGERCLTHDLWQDLSDQISHFLNNITLHELMAENEVDKVTGRQNHSANALIQNIDIDIQI